MKLIIQSVLLVCALFPISFVGAADQAKVVRSPDEKFFARIITAPKVTPGAPEIMIEILDSHGKPVTKEDFTSEDGEHGLSIDRAEWTPDSQFFVFTTYSSGGHQAWQFPAFFFDRRDKKIHRFDDFLAPIADGRFVLKSPDYVTITIWTPLTPDKPLDKSIELPITFRMRDLTQGKK